MAFEQYFFRFVPVSILLGTLQIRTMVAVKILKYTILIL